MIEHPRDLLRPARGKRVVDRGGEIGEDHRRREQARPGEEGEVVGPCGPGDEKGRAHERGEQPGAVAHAVRDLLGGRLRTQGAGIGASFGRHRVESSASFRDGRNPTSLRPRRQGLVAAVAQTL